MHCSVEAQRICVLADVPFKKFHTLASYRHLGRVRKGKDDRHMVQYASHSLSQSPRSTFTACKCLHLLRLIDLCHSGLLLLCLILSWLLELVAAREHTTALK
jgi:hypothetical protein